MEVITWFYDEFENYFVDEDGEPVYDIFRVISPNRLFYLKYMRDRNYDHTEYIKDPKSPDVVYEIIFAADEEDGFDYDEYFNLFERGVKNVKK